MLMAAFVSDLHGDPSRYGALFRYMEDDPPDALFIGGDLFPGLIRSLFNVVPGDSFIRSVLINGLDRLRDKLKTRYPDIFVILGNDDGRYWEPAVLDMAANGYWTYLHKRHVSWEGFDLYGYNYVPPTPFRLKDWERYDVSRFVDPGSIAPGEGALSVPVSDYDLNWATIAEDLEGMTSGQNMERAIMLFHAPPYQTRLDRAALDGKMIDHVPLDPHVGSIAVKRFIEDRQPLLTLHGHVHESTELTGSFQELIGRTVCLNGAHNGPELALITFSPGCPGEAQRLLL